ncbi:Hypothetical protein LUCI_1651 [Lucifera butyrica]|uniref:Quinate 5-dehydrogenase n=1 Tax=Lucifera butyrica TaxID=1351585 RepID=A0A498R6B7_9FIRM|nr:quinate 5-dehydrogenase [Lucifera butyrica]VBB06420.1 Hypothetical protein LUCI_1651 [Lucifera butyrica]
MKHIVSVSLGSSRRNGKVTEVFGGQTFLIERIGTDGDKEKAIQLIRSLDGQVNAFGLGGTDLYIYAGDKRYTFRESKQIAAAAQKTPIVDGSGLKNTLERNVIHYLKRNESMCFEDKSVLVVCAVDRFGLAQAFVNAGSRTVFGDLLFGLGLPWPIYSLSGLSRLAKLVAPVITQLPIHLFYPTGKQQNEVKPRFEKYFAAADIIAGDFHFIRRYMPSSLADKIVITNTVTQEDENLLRNRGVSILVTTTPEMGGRSFGTNVLEAVLVTQAGKRPDQLTAQDYEQMLQEMDIMPRIKKLSV